MLPSNLFISINDNFSSVLNTANFNVNGLFLENSNLPALLSLLLVISPSFL